MSREMSGATFYKQCRPLYLKAMSLVCSEVVPELIAKEDMLIRLKDPYSVFQLKSDPKMYMVLFQSMEAQYCQVLRMIDMKSFRCTYEDKGSSILFFEYSHQECHTESHNVTDTLIQFCGAQNFENTLSGFFYANDINLLESRASGRFFETPGVVICLMIVLLVVLIMH
ncbi:hypothetical protein KR018_007005 [Drosophila ironensis]|nr:hypothetical protein KR018_007005 [Drosophila ironensis]